MKMRTRFLTVAMAAALLFLLLVNPMSIAGIGLQLSFACMLGFAVLLPRLTAGIGRVQKRLRRLPRPLQGLIGVTLANLAASLSATAFSIPVAAYYFGTVPLLSPTIGLVLIINSISAFKVFNSVVVLFSGTPGPMYNMYTMTYYIYEQINTSMEYGRAAAASLILFAVILVFTMLQRFIQRKWNYT